MQWLPHTFIANFVATWSLPHAFSATVCATAVLCMQIRHSDAHRKCGIAFFSPPLLGIFVTDLWYIFSRGLKDLSGMYSESINSEFCIDWVVFYVCMFGVCCGIYKNKAAAGETSVRIQYVLPTVSCIRLKWLGKWIKVLVSFSIYILWNMPFDSAWC